MIFSVVGKLGGSTDWKLSHAAADLAAQATARGMPVHMGRVNSRRRLTYAAAIGCRSVDGNHLTYQPDRYLTEVLRWLDELHRANPAPR